MGRAPASPPREGEGHGEGGLGLSTLVDTILLARCNFLIKPKSAVSEFAIYYNRRLINASYDFELRGQPQPTAAWWRKGGGRGGAAVP